VSSQATIETYAKLPSNVAVSMTCVSYPSVLRLEAPAALCDGRVVADGLAVASVLARKALWVFGEKRHRFAGSEHVQAVAMPESVVKQPGLFFSTVDKHNDIAASGGWCETGRVVIERGFGFGRRERVCLKTKRGFKHWIGFNQLPTVAECDGTEPLEASLTDSGLNLLQLIQSSFLFGCLPQVFILGGVRRYRHVQFGRQFSSPNGV